MGEIQPDAAKRRIGQRLAFGRHDGRAQRQDGRVAAAVPGHGEAQCDATLDAVAVELSEALQLSDFVVPATERGIGVGQFFVRRQQAGGFGNGPLECRRRLLWTPPLSQADAHQMVRRRHLGVEAKRQLERGHGAVEVAGAVAGERRLVTGDG
jgi:hypothetical protein